MRAGPFVLDAADAHGFISFKQNRDRPRASLEPSSERASTNWISAQPLVIKRFTPLMRQIPAASSKVALVWTAPRSEPASGFGQYIAR